MAKLAVLLFIVAVCACCISAFPSPVPSGDYVRIVRAALPDPYPRRHHHQQGYESDYYGGHNHYDNYDNNYGGYNQRPYNQGYGDYYNNYPQNNGQTSSSNANSASFNTPWGSGSYAQANSQSGTGGGSYY